MPRRNQEVENLWLARVLWELGSVRFGDFTVGRTTVHSPVYVNVRRIISRPRMLKRAASVMAQEVAAELGRLHARMSPFDLVAGVPLGGLHLATAFSLHTSIPMIYAHRRSDGSDGYVVEGHFEPDQTVLLIDDLITTGGSILEQARMLENEGLRVKDAVVLIDRGEGAATRLRHAGYNLFPIVNLEVMLNYYLSTGRMDENLHRKCCQYIHHRRKEFGNE